jgi:bifunctional UDP-N-acetylglucosamine pyrophosphorylase / glucosamine-1-phosphate N-acetyltransferase
MLQCVIDTVRKVKNDKLVVVTGRHSDLIRQTLAADDITYVLQDEPKGTGHALICARQVLRNFRGTLLVLNGDSPLVSPGTLKKFLKLHMRSKSTVSVLSFIAANPDNYGRIVRDTSGRVLSIMEQKDADPVQKKICEVNSGVYAIDHESLPLLDEIKANRKKGEYYLTDIVALCSRKGFSASALCVGTEQEFMGVNTRRELYRASVILKEAVVGKWMEKGVNILDTNSVFIHPHAVIGPETTLYPNVYIEGNTKIGKGVTVYPNVRISDSLIDAAAVIRDSTLIEKSHIKSGAAIGPFAHIRPGCDIGSGAKIGNFVELKKTIVGSGVKASHLSYLGDAMVGRGVNIGAGTITCNYDGKKKSRTIIGEDVFVGSDSQLIAPVRIGRGAYIGAGSTITRDVPPQALAVTRVEQRIIKNWAKKREARLKKDISTDQKKEKKK